MRAYKARKAGQVLLACGKCERKLAGRLKVRKELKKLAKKDPEPVLFNVVRVGCLKLCPKGGVTVCTRDGLGRDRMELGIVWGKGEVREIYEGGKGLVLPDGPPARGAVTP